MDVEKILENLNCQTIVFRVTNVWGGIVDKTRVNGLVDKLLTLLDTDEVVEIYANLKTTVDIVHVDDIVRLILKITLHLCLGPTTQRPMILRRLLRLPAGPQIPTPPPAMCRKISAKPHGATIARNM